MRLRARAFVIADPAEPLRRVAFVSVDLGQLYQAVSQAVLVRLGARFGGVYDARNVLLSATHTHGGPGGFSHYALYNLSAGGFSPQSFEAIVGGIVEAVARAHDNLAEGVISLSTGELAGVGRNRSPAPFAQNPADERALYPEKVDTTMTVLRFDRLGAASIGAVAWFAVHGTSLSKDNRLISGDNKGYASYLFEREMGTDYAAADTFVAAFAQSDCGDVSPNVGGDLDGDGDWDGEGHPDERESAAISGRKQYERARALYESGTPLERALDYRHAFVDMSDVSVDGGSTCYAALGVSMLAGTEDGPGVGSEGVTCADDPPLAECDRLRRRLGTLGHEGAAVAVLDPERPTEGAVLPESDAAGARHRVVLPRTFPRERYAGRGGPAVHVGEEVHHPEPVAAAGGSTASPGRARRGGGPPTPTSR